MKLAVRTVATMMPWRACLLPVEFPVSDQLRPSLRSFLEQLTLLVENQTGLQSHVLFQTWKLHVENTGDDVHTNLEMWQPRLGLGVWPNRPPPGLWTQDRFMDANAAKIQNEEPELPAYRLLHLAAIPHHARCAAAALFGVGGTMQLFSEGKFDDVARAGKEFYLPTIKVALYTHERFYVPLLDTASLAAAHSSDALDQWLQRIQFYIRESTEDHGVLIVSRHPLQSLLERAASLSSLELLLS